MVRVVAFLVLVFLAAVDCGPSFQAVYESDVHFEHCYALDQGQASNDSKRNCWRAWLRAYTYGQPRDRVDYASARFAALSPDEAQSSPRIAAAAAHSARPAIDAPVPTNAFAPPPNVASAAPTVASATPTADSGVSSVDAGLRVPGLDCADACASAWQACRGGCKDAACVRCDNAYRTCMPACFVDKKPAAR